MRDLNAVIGDLQSQISSLQRQLEALKTVEANYFSTIKMVDGVTAPDTINNYCSIYVDTSDGDLKIKFGDGTVKTITTDT